VLILTDLMYQNLLASGNAPIKLKLDNHASTLIVGRNGTGKSTFSEAISLALFGVPLRKITKAKLVNAVNGRDCLVELGFIAQGKPYRVRRGIKPNIFEIFENGVLIEPPADLKDYQTILEENILHLNHKSFVQVVVLGSASFVPFMRLNVPARRTLIEDLLDINVFSSMNASTKEDLSDVKNKYDKAETTKSLIGEQRRMVGVFEDQFEERKAADLAALDAKVLREDTALEADRKKHAELKEAHATYAGVSQEVEDIRAQVRDFERKKTKVDTLLATYATERRFLDEHDTCPTCEQTISEDLKEQRYAVLDGKEAQATTVLSHCDAALTKHKAAMKTALAELEEANAIERDMRAADTAISMHLTYLRGFKADRERIAKTTQKRPDAVNVDELDAKIEELEKLQATLAEQRVVVEAATMLLKDNGIKARVVKHYLPIINRTINHYLNAMDFPILFTLDEEFNEAIKSRHRDDFSYESFSEGEKKRIDLALLLTWRHIARLKNSASTNILILDEVFDSSLDAAGTEEFLKIIADLEKDTSVFVISHKTDQLIDKFGSTIIFEKTKGFSTIS